MNASYEVRNGYLFVKATGEFTSASLRNICSECLDAAHRHAVDRVVCDITLVTGFDDIPSLTLTHFETATFVAKFLPRGFKLAVLETSQQLAKDRFPENVMRNEGASVMLTASLNEALEWLGVARKAEAGRGR